MPIGSDPEAERRMTVEAATMQPLPADTQAPRSRVVIRRTDPHSEYGWPGATSRPPPILLRRLHGAQGEDPASEAQEELNI